MEATQKIPATTTEDFVCWLQQERTLQLVNGRIAHSSQRFIARLADRPLTRTDIGSMWDVVNDLTAGNISSELCETFSELAALVAA